MPELSTPIPYSPSLETREPHEAETTRELMETLAKIRQVTYEDSGHAMRSVHAKSHGLLRGEVVVPADLPQTLRQGVFAQPARFDAIVRLSTPPGDVLSDRVSVPRALALKLVGVPGERLPGSEGDTTQDLIMVNGPAFLAPSLKDFLDNLKLLAATTNKGKDAKKALSLILRGTEKVVEALGGESNKLKSMGGHPLTHPLGDSYFTQAALRFGDYVGKLSLAPATDALLALKGAALSEPEDDDALRLAVNAFFAAQAGEWDLRVQLCRDLETMPIEDASVPWPEDRSPYLTVARLRLPRQTAWDSASPEREDRLSFSPWHGVLAHQPLGSIMRARKPAYEASVAFRAERNRCPVNEPAALLTDD